MTAMLSFENAPPLSVPARFFATAPFYGVLAGLLIIVEGGELMLSRWSPAVLTLTHLLTVGVLMQVMIGALFQFLPVAADAGIQNSPRVASVVHPLLNLGALFLSAGFYWSQPILLKVSAFALAMAIGLFVVVALLAVLRKPHTSPTIPALKLALLGLGVTLGLGLYLLAVYAFGVVGRANVLTAQHAAWGLIGWSATLMVGVAYVVVPMFQLTPAYTRRVTSALAPLLFFLLLAWSAVQAMDGVFGIAAIGFALALTLGVFATVTLSLQGKSRRAEADTTFLYWRLGMLCVLLASGLWAAQPLFDMTFSHYPVALAQLAIALGVLSIFGVLVSVVNGMLYKILPFLCWLHLQQVGMEIGVYKTPHMGVFLGERRMRLQFFWHIATLALLLIGVAFPSVLLTAGFAMCGSFVFLAANLWLALSAMQREKGLILSGLSASR